MRSLDQSKSGLVLQSELILHPRIHVGTLEASVQIAFSLQVSRVQLARFGVVAGEQVGFDFLLALPWLKVGQLWEWCGCAHPLDGLIVAHHVHILVGQQFVQEANEHGKVALLLEPNGVEVQAERGSVRLVVTIEVVLQHAVYFLVGQVSGTRVDHGANVALRIMMTLNYWLNTLPSVRTSISKGFMIISHIPLKDRDGHRCREPWHLCGIR